MIHFLILGILHNQVLAHPDGQVEQVLGRADGKTEAIDQRFALAPVTETKPSSSDCPGPG